MPSYVSTIIICAVLVLIAFFAIRNYIKKLSNGCCGAEGDGIQKVKPSDTNKNNYPFSKTIEIEGITCKTVPQEWKMLLILLMVSTQV